ncbi:MAG TPA: hypothetical protein VE441_06030, partial [Mycobacterium sp.]|nr:hypothetical protein [Mycobacterium sp.]
MGRTSDVEFLAEGGSGREPGDEVLDVGRARRVPRWLSSGVAVGMAVAVAAIAVGRDGSGQHGPRAAASSSHARPNRPPPRSASSIGAPLAVGSGAVLDVAATGQHTWVLHADRVTGLWLARGRNRTAPLPRLDLSTPTSTARLVLDVGTARLWVVIEGTRPGRAIEYDLWTLARLRDLRLPSINGAAAMSGHLYASSGQHLIDIPVRGPARIIPLPDVVGALGPIAADPAHSRVLVLDYHAPSHLWVYRPGHHLIRAPVRLPLATASIAVTRQSIWLGGFAAHAAVLARLNPTTLRPSMTSPLSGQLGQGAVMLTDA